ncbi:MAG: response regulator [Acidobacteria bacterium]|jgi:CheY-like chemotaxis protein|nr:response regulator [Acidobacteriota bacterium]
MKPRALFVDDEPHVLSALKRQFHNLFVIDTASCGEDGLEVLQGGGRFAVVVSDYRMPGMSGVAFLAKAREIAPDTVRVVLTGQADMEAAISAVNEGNVFRFLTKPCPAFELVRALQACVAQHHLLIAERELLEQTLAGVVKMLTEVLALVSPDAFGRATRTKDCVLHLAHALRLPAAWQFEMAALLAPVGLISLPPDTLTRALGGLMLSPAERDAVAGHPRVAASLVGHIPRLDLVAQMIARQFDALPDAPATAEGLGAEPPSTVGARLLQIATALDDRLMQGAGDREAVSDLRKTGAYPAYMVDALETFAARRVDGRVREIGVKELNTFMVLDQDVCSRAGLLLVSKGQPVTVAVIQRLRTFAQGIGVREPFRVRIPSDPASSTVDAGVAV